MKALKLTLIAASVIIGGFAGACFGQILAIGWSAWSTQIVAEIAALVS